MPYNIGKDEYEFNIKKLEKLHRDIVIARDEYSYGNEWKLLHNLQGFITKVDIYENKNPIDVDILNISISALSAKIQYAMTLVENAQNSLLGFLTINGRRKKEIILLEYRTFLFKPETRY